jgi:NAD(P)-dependent dehydrogenase (short-subunit alcohol dehydrogenase family)
MNISGKAVLVTGANRGTGRALVEEALNGDASRPTSSDTGVRDLESRRIQPAEGLSGVRGRAIFDGVACDEEA